MTEPAAGSKGRGGDGDAKPDAKLRDLAYMPDPDAIEQRPLGGVTTWVLAGLTAMLIAAVTWASLSEIDEIITAPGRLVSSQPNLLVQPLDSSIVQSIDVRAGQVVKEGQQLASLDATFTGADQAMITGSIAKLQARERRLEAEIASGVGLGSPGAAMGSLDRVKGAGGDSAARPGDERLQTELKNARAANFQSRLKALDENIARLEASLATNRQDQKMLAERVRSLGEIEQMQQKLVDQNFGARKALLDARDGRMAIEREQQLTRNREQEVLREIAALKAERAAFQNDWRQRAIEELAEVRKERDGMLEQLQKAQKRNTLVVLRAPVNGVVLEIPKKSIGSVVQAGESMFTLVPTDVPLLVELQVSSPDAGFVKVGDPVKVKLDAFPFQKYGTLKGKVQVVSEDSFSRDPYAPTGNKPLSGNYYLARVSLETTELERKSPRNDDVSLRPGFTVSGEIVIGRRSVMSYFLYPLIGTLDESLRERR
jgi:HlyD family secretion protein